MSSGPRRSPAQQAGAVADRASRSGRRPGRSRPAALPSWAGSARIAASGSYSCADGRARCGRARGSRRRRPGRRPSRGRRCARARRRSRRRAADVDRAGRHARPGARRPGPRSARPRSGSASRVAPAVPRELRRRLGLDLGERRLERGGRDLVAAQHQRAHDLVLGVGEQEPERAEDAGRRRDQHVAASRARGRSRRRSAGRCRRTRTA